MKFKTNRLSDSFVRSRVYLIFYLFIYFLTNWMDAFSEKKRKQFIIGIRLYFNLSRILGNHIFINKRGYDFQIRSSKVK
ncbi:hypothetical protein PGB90_005560 [Kerria lacca]